MKPATAKAKGRDTENALVEWMKANGVPYAERRRLNGTKDKGDIAGLPGVVIEVKSAARLDLATWMAELDCEITNDQAATGALVMRPKGKPHPDAWWACMPLPLWWELMRAAGWIAEGEPDA